MRTLIEEHPVLFGLLGVLVGAIITGIFTFWGSERGGVLLSIEATQTAEAANERIAVAVARTVAAEAGSSTGGMDAPQNPCNEYGIKITEPDEGYFAANGEAFIEGEYTLRPPQDSLQLIVIANDLYWPQPREEVRLRTSEQTWSGKAITEGGIFLVAAVIGDSGRILFDYFGRAGSETGTYVGIAELPNDVVECDRVFVRSSN